MANAKKKLDLHVLTECAIMVALATVLSLIKVYDAPYGGSVTLLSMAPIIVLSVHRGIVPGVAAGFVHSMIQLMLGLANVGWIPDLGGKVLVIFLDYLIPFTLLGLGGMFRKVNFTESKKVNAVIQAVLGTLVVTVIRYLCHIISGVVVWYALDLVWYADDPGHIVNRYGAWAFSAIYNGTFMVPEIIETMVGVPLILPAVKRATKRFYTIRKSA